MLPPLLVCLNRNTLVLLESTSILVLNFLSAIIKSALVFSLNNRCVFRNLFSKFDQNLAQFLLAPHLSRLSSWCLLVCLSIFSVRVSPSPTPMTRKKNYQRPLDSAGSRFLVAMSRSLSVGTQLKVGFSHGCNLEHRCLSLL